MNKTNKNIMNKDRKEDEKSTRKRTQWKERQKNKEIILIKTSELLV